MNRTRRHHPVLLFLFVALAGCVGCVGPTTPLGAVDHPTLGYRPATEPAQDLSAEPAGQRAEIVFSPTHQRVHGPYTWQVLLLDPSGEGLPELSGVRIFYNGMEVTVSSRSQFRVEQEEVTVQGQPALLLQLPHLRLDPLAEHRIRVDYTTAAGACLSAAYEFPILEDLDAQETLATTQPFHLEPDLLEILQAASREFAVNPVVLAALIAQESSFDPLALSRARALGLTQVTHRTEPDIARQFPGWPRNPNLGRFSQRELRGLIPAVIHRDNEWRLDPEKSIRGGAFYLGYLRDRLQAEVNRPYLNHVGTDHERIVAEASLAAYNSGLNRILYMMKTHGPEWLEQKQTREAKRYVRKILSYYGAFRSPPGSGASFGDAT